MTDGRSKPQKYHHHSPSSRKEAKERRDIRFQRLSFSSFVFLSLYLAVGVIFFGVSCVLCLCVSFSLLLSFKAVKACGGKYPV